MEYKLVYGNLRATIEDAVNEAMKDGWVPHGSLVDTQGGFVQPMTRMGYYYTQMVEDRKVEKELMG